MQWRGRQGWRAKAGCTRRAAHLAALHAAACLSMAPHPEACLSQVFLRLLRIIYRSTSRKASRQRLITARISSSEHTCIYRTGALLDEVVLYATIDDHASSQENEQGKESPSVLPPLTTHHETALWTRFRIRSWLLSFLSRKQPILPEMGLWGLEPQPFKDKKTPHNLCLILNVSLRFHQITQSLGHSSSSPGHVAHGYVFRGATRV